MSAFERVLEQLEKRDHYVAERVPFVSMERARIASGRVREAEQALAALEASCPAEYADARESYGMRCFGA